MSKKLSLFFLVITASLYAFSANAIEAGQAAPVFTLPTLQKDQPFSLKNQTGKVIYLDFWASWCLPCRTSFPLLNKLHEKLKAQGFEVIAINLDEDKAKAEKFLQEFQVGFSVLRDAKGEWADKYVVESMPTSFIIDKKGMISYVHHGFTSTDINEIEQKITALLVQK
jgi:thiol-disulfide isomerase/thioredoxin